MFLAAGQGAGGRGAPWGPRIGMVCKAEFRHGQGDSDDTFCICHFVLQKVEQVLNGQATWKL